jgi:RHS repeat-associated protein
MMQVNPVTARSAALDNMSLMWRGLFFMREGWWRQQGNPVMSDIHTDHLGRPTRFNSATKATMWTATWKPWGEIQSLSGTATNNLRFPGQYFQIETGLHYNHHRHYDPVTGRYTQPDPLGFVDGPSVYAYVRNSPTMRIDRTGLFISGKKLSLPSGGTSYSGECTSNPAFSNGTNFDNTTLFHLVARSSRIKCKDCKTPTGTTTAPYCPDCYSKLPGPKPPVPKDIDNDY